MNNIKRILSITSSNCIIKNRNFINKQQTTKLFYSTKNGNNNNNNKLNKQQQEDLKMVKDFLNQIKEEKEFLNKYTNIENPQQSDFIYEKGDIRKVTESFAKSITTEFEEQLKREDDVYNRLLTDLKNRKIEREQLLQKEKSKTNTIHYILTALIGICIIKYYYMGAERNNKNQLEFNENWEKLRIIVNNRDTQKEKKFNLINSLSNKLQEKQPNEDIDDIKDNVESIVTQYCIENKLPNQVTIENNDISNSKI